MEVDEGQGKLHPAARRDGSPATWAGCTPVLTMATLLSVSDQPTHLFLPAEQGCHGGKAMEVGGQLDAVNALFELHICI